METKKLPNSAISSETTLQTVSTFLLWIGILSSIIVCILGLYYIEHNAYLIGIGISGLLTSIASAILLKVIAEISITLKRIDFRDDPEYYSEEKSNSNYQAYKRKADGKILYKTITYNSTYALFKDEETNTFIKLAIKDVEPYNEDEPNEPK